MYLLKTNLSLNISFIPIPMYKLFGIFRVLMMGDKRKKGKGGKRSRDGTEIQVKMPPSYPSTDVGFICSFVLM